MSRYQSVEGPASGARKLKLVAIKMPDKMIKLLDECPIGTSRSAKMRVLMMLGISSIWSVPDTPGAGKSGGEYAMMTVHLPRWVIDYAKKMVDRGYATSIGEAIRLLVLLGVAKLENNPKKEAEVK